MEDKNNTQIKIKSRFKELMQKTETDPQLKNEVFGTIAKIDAAASFFELFTVKMVETNTSFFDEINTPQHPLSTDENNTDINVTNNLK
jgi:hypothetical protein